MYAFNTSHSCYRLCNPNAGVAMDYATQIAGTITVSSDFHRTYSTVANYSTEKYLILGKMI